MLKFETKLFDMHDISLWLLMTIAKNWSTNRESLVLKISSVLNIYLKSDYASHNGDKDEDQTIVSPCGQFGDNIGTNTKL